MPKSSYLKHQVSKTELDDGTFLLESELPLGPIAKNTGEWLHRWADEAPQRDFLMERSGAGWRKINYSETLQQVQALAASLLAQGMGPGTPVVVLSGPSIDHGILMLATQYIGMPLVPLAEQYSLIPEAANRLDYCVNKVKPALVYASDGHKFGSALNRDSLAYVKKLVSTNVPRDTNGFTALQFDDLLKGKPDKALEDAVSDVGPEALAKILFTSGSTGNPKGVLQSQEMLTVNQAQYLSCLPMFAERPPVIVDWLPWSHVFAGNSNFNVVLSNGGTLILDDGKPVKGLFDRTLENLSMHVGTLSFNVPVAYALLVEALSEDKKLRNRFFADLDLIFYAGASLPIDIWSALERMALEVSGKIPMMTSSWGLTETAPACLLHHQGGAASGMIGVPVPALKTKLIPYSEGRFEIRVKGPNVISSYFEAPDVDAKSFDDEGYLITNDAVRFVDPNDPAAGVRFDGRITEDFKLLTGTKVQAADIRLRALDVLKEFVQDIVVTGADRNDIGLLIFPLQAISPANDGEVVTDTDYIDKLTLRLKSLNGKASGSSNRIARVLLMAQPPSIKNSEITAKGSLNISAILSCRASLLERLYVDSDSACIMV
ncbi:MAG: AMP-binding protein [Granulosicoccus sp.]